MFLYFTSGTKYIVDGLLFKVANPAEGPYLSSFELANKAAGHDLRGAIAIYHAIGAVKAQVPMNLNISLMGIIDHLGFRVSRREGERKEGLRTLCVVLCACCALCMLLLLCSAAYVLLCAFVYAVMCALCCAVCCELHSITGINNARLLPLLLYRCLSSGTGHDSP